MRSQDLALAGLVAIVGASALAFGSTELWASSWLLAASSAVFAAAFWNAPPRAWLSGTAGAVAVPAILLVAWAFVQTVPLPRSVVSVLSPGVSRVQTALVPDGGGEAIPRLLVDRATAQGYSLAEGTSAPAGIPDAGSRSARSGLSVNPHATRRAAFSWLAPVLLFLAAHRVAGSRLLRYRLLWGIAAWAGVLGAIAVAEKVAGNGRLLWIRDMPPAATPIGPFVNPNHFAGWMEIGLLVALGLVLALLGGSTRRLSYENLRAALLDRAWALPRLLALGGAVVLGTCGILLSQSRGGLVALAAGLVVLVPFGRARAWLPLLAAIVLLAGFGVGLAAWLGHEEQQLQTAFFAAGGSDPSLSMRSDIWGRTFRILADHPWTGTGLGTFRWAYGAYDREGEWLATEQAHNDYLQLASETGVVGVALLAWCFAAFGLRVLRPALRAGDAPAGWTTIALAAAVFAMLGHSVIEFNLQIPAVAALFAVAAGALAAAAEDRGTRGGERES